MPVCPHNIPMHCCSGRYYYEATVTDEGLCRVGWSTLKAKLDLGTCKEGFGFGGTGKKSFGRQFDSYGEVSRRSAWVIGVTLTLKVLVTDSRQLMHSGRGWGM